ncbi:hypothetical protein [Caulobacter sp.]|uniref:hypothetical protein n=1 Tax=Caulobacter sp. TaxID=78 RepID=UPI002B498FF7|nr:hypothetical protein [Caulobacter sp.]HJV43362.1 hypothetical protein [Caulobacter sp.]
MSVTENPTLLRPVARWSGWAANACVGLAALFVIATLWKWALSTPHAIQVDLDLRHVNLSIERRTICVVLGVTPAVVLGLGLMRLRGSFQCFARGELFSYRAIAGLKDFAAASAASVLVGAVVAPLISMVVSWRGGSDVEAAMSIGTGSLTLLLISMVTWIFGHVLGLGAQLAAENDAFV